MAPSTIPRRLLLKGALSAVALTAGPRTSRAQTQALPGQIPMQLAPPPPPPREPALPPRPQVDIGPLTSFAAALYDLETGRRSAPVVFLQFGDSHTAGDRFSGRLRELFQAEFGDSGRGMMGAGKAFDYFQPTHVSIEQSEGWQVESSLTGDTSRFFGMTGYRITAEDEEDELVLSSDQFAGFDTLSIEFLNRRNGGGFEIFVDGDLVHTQDTQADASRLARVDVVLEPNSRQIRIRPRGDGPVTLLAWSTERARPGVLLESHGIIGASVGIMDHWNRPTVAWEIQQRSPALIILAYGTNEGFNLELELDEYAATFETELSFVRQAAPYASIVIVGPPDANRLPSACLQDGEREGSEFPCGPLTDREIADYERLFGSDASGDSCRWHPPPNLAAVREIERSAAERHGVLFWDWSEVMDGACGIHDWVRADPPLAHADHVHLRADGYRRSADALYQVLMDQYRAYRSRAGGA